GRPGGPDHRRGGDHPRSGHPHDRGLNGQGFLMDHPRLVVGISGSSGPQYGIALLRALRDIGEVETHLVLSEGARETIPIEAGVEPEQVEALADVVYSPTDLAAAVSSGSFLTLGMAVIPCSMKTLAAVAN